MEKTSPWAALYFVALMTFGNYVLFNLLVAILVEGFAAEGERKRSMEALANAENQQKVIEETNLDFDCKVSQTIFWDYFIHVEPTEE